MPYVEPLKIKVCIFGFCRDTSLRSSMIFEVLRTLKKKVYLVLPSNCKFKVLHLMSVNKKFVMSTGMCFTEVEVYTNKEIDLKDIEAEVSEIVNSKGFGVSVAKSEVTESEKKRIKELMDLRCDGRA